MHEMAAIMEAVKHDKEIIRRDQMRAAQRRYYHAYKNSLICQYCQKALSSAYSWKSHLRTQHGHVDVDPMKPNCYYVIVGVRRLACVALLGF